MGMALQLPTMVHAIPKGGLILRPVPWINRKLSVYHNTTRRWRVHSQRKLEEHVGVESQGDEPPLLVFDEEAREESESRVKDRSLIGRLWVLAVLGATYVHNSVSAFALPALLPQISGELGLEDFQAALLTSGYSVIYALSLIPAGFLADKLSRPQLLAVGATSWTLLTFSEASSSTFAQLMIARSAFAGAQAVQNPVCFTLIPELFPQNRALALAVYNSFMHIGRALSFAALALASGMDHSTGYDGQPKALLVPMDQLDLSKVSVLYVQGDLIAITPVYDYAKYSMDGITVSPEAVATWRSVLTTMATPGFVVAGLLMLTLSDPTRPIRVFDGVRKMMGGQDGVEEGGRGMREMLDKWDDWRVGRRVQSRKRLLRVGAQIGLTTKKTQGERRRLRARKGSTVATLSALVTSKPFLGVAAAASLVDVGTWSLVAWQATFYERVYDLPSSVYGPLLAGIIPVSGIVGGVGGGLLGDRLSKAGARKVLTGGATIAAGPVLAASLLAPTYEASFALLLVGLMLSEVWRSNAAVMVRSISEPEVRSTATAVWLTTRNVVAAAGPLSVAALAGSFGLRHAMLLAPAAFVASGLAFLWTENELERNPRPPSTEA